MKITQALPKLVTFDEFVAWYPENIGVRYEPKRITYLTGRKHPDSPYIHRLKYEIGMIFLGKIYLFLGSFRLRALFCVCCQ